LQTVTSTEHLDAVIHRSVEALSPSVLAIPWPSSESLLSWPGKSVYIAQYREQS